MYEASDFFTDPDVWLMNTYTGSVATAQEWASEAHTWIVDDDITDPQDIFDEISLQFEELLAVELIDGEWEEVK